MSDSITTISIKDMRNNIASIIDDTFYAGKTFIVTKFGKPRAKLIPIFEEGDKNSDKELQNLPRKKRLVIKKTTGIWKNRADITDSVAFAKKIRNRDESLFD